MVGRAGFEPATIRFLRVSLVGWATPTVGRHLQRLRQPNIDSELTRKLCQAELPPVAKSENRRLKTNILALVTLHPQFDSDGKRLLKARAGRTRLLTENQFLKNTITNKQRLIDMKGALVFIIAFILFLAATLAYADLPPGKQIYDALNVPSTDYPSVRNSSSDTC